MTNFKKYWAESASESVLNDYRSGNVRRVGDWIKLKCGDRVLDVRDPRHDGRVVAVNNGVIAVVKWDNGWKSEHPVSNLRKL
jgi:hypothetical protein